MPDARGSSRRFTDQIGARRAAAKVGGLNHSPSFTLDTYVHLLDEDLPEPITLRRRPARWLSLRRIYDAPLARAQGAMAVAVYGREDLIAAIARSRAPVTLVTGDSGVGKSTVLAAAQAASRQSVAPPPRMLRRSGGALQRGLLDTLSVALSLTAPDPQSAREVARYLVDGAQRIANETLDELPVVLAKEALAIARGFVGEDAMRAVSDFLRALGTPVDRRLAAQLVAAANPSVAETLARLTEEVRAFAGSEHLLIALDGGEQLNDEDLRILADLAVDLPDRVCVRLAFSTYSSEQRDRADLLIGSSDRVAEHAVTGLAPDAIARWLSDEDLDRDVAASVARATYGYPLHVEGMIAHLGQGGDVDDAPLNQQFARRTEEAWHSLPPDVSRHARTLSVLREPLPVEKMRGFLGLDLAGWADIEARLWRSRIFSVEVDGQRWFHPQRRQYLVDQVLSPEEIEEAATQATDVVYALVEETQSPERLPDLAELVSASAARIAEDPQLATAVSMDTSELALAAALVEVVDPRSSEPLIEADLLLRYARSVFRTDGDLVEALRRLGAREGVLVQEAGGAAVVGAYWNSGLVVATIVGRTSRELGRSPVPGAASAVFGLEIYGRLAPFRNAQYGLGHPSFGALSEMALDLRREPWGQTIVLGRPDPGANLLLRGSYAGRGFYAAVTYERADDRDAARTRLAGLTGEVFGQDFSVDDLLDHPADPVPSRRFVEAAERVIGRSLGHSFSSSKPSLRLRSPVDPEEAISRRASLVRAVRASSSWLELVASQTDEPLAYAFYAEDDFVVEAEVRGGREGVLPIVSLPPLGNDDPFAFFRLAEAIGLVPGERLRTYRVRVGVNHNDPAVAALATLFENSHSFNRNQRRWHTVLFDEQWLEDHLTAAARRCLADARTLVESSAFGEDARVAEARTTYLAVELEPPQTGWVSGAHSLASYVLAPSADGDERVRVAIVPKSPTGGVPVPVSADFRQLFGLDNADQYSGGSGALRSILAGMLGYLEEELRFEYPSSPSSR